MDPPPEEPEGGASSSASESSQSTDIVKSKDFQMDFCDDGVRLHGRPSLLSKLRRFVTGGSVRQEAYDYYAAPLDDDDDADDGEGGSRAKSRRPPPPKVRYSGFLRRSKWLLYRLPLFTVLFL